MGSKAARADIQIAEIAARQHGVVSATQLAGVGVDRGTITRRAQAGRLHRVHRGVYAVGHSALSQEGKWMAAVLACGMTAVLSFQSAAQLWRMLPPRSGFIEVTIAGGGGRKRHQGLRRHRSTSLTSDDVTRHHRIPVTTPARTIADLRRSAPELARRAIRQAAVIGLHIPEEVEADRPRSELEARFLRLCRRHRLPIPEVNVPIGRFTVDFLWRERRLVVETDGYRFHRGRQAFEDDRARDVELRLQGYEVIRFTYRQVTEDPNGVAQPLEAILN